MHVSNWVKQVQAISNYLQNWYLILGEHIWTMSLDFALKLPKQTFPREAFLHFNYEIKRHIQRRENYISRQSSFMQKKKKLICLHQMFSNNWVFHSFNFLGIKLVYWWKYHNNFLVSKSNVQVVFLQNVQRKTITQDRRSFLP